MCASVRLENFDAARASAEEFKSHFGLMNLNMISRGAWTEEELKRVKRNLRSVDVVAE